MNFVTLVYMRATILVLVGLLAGCTQTEESIAPIEECPLGFDDCNGDPADGCETDLTSSARACGDCSNVCVAPVGGLQVCVASECGIDCDPGLVRCGDECVASCDTSFEAAGEVNFDVPTDCTRVLIKAWGAGGGNGARNTNSGAAGFVRAEVAAAVGEQWTVVVGSPGISAVGRTPGLGGAPGGGNGGNASSDGGGGGGGYSGVFRGAISVQNALVIAGGGGGSGGGTGTQVLGGAGGGTDGQNGGENNAAGGTQLTGAAALAAGNGNNDDDGGGGGGGGWFGGEGGNGANSDAFGGGGGSGFVTPDAVAPMLVPGNRQLPGLPDDPDRGTAGAPGAPGKITIDCLPDE